MEQRSPLWFLCAKWKFTLIEFSVVVYQVGGSQETGSVLARSRLLVLPFGVADFKVSASNRDAVLVFFLVELQPKASGILVICVKRFSGYLIQLRRKTSRTAISIKSKSKGYKSKHITCQRSYFLHSTSITYH